VAKDQKKVAKGELLSPVLLVRGQAAAGVALIVADGHHRICASYLLGLDADIPCRIVDPPLIARPGVRRDEHGLSKVDFRFKGLRGDAVR
jgi:hypothetical protein